MAVTESLPELPKSERGFPWLMTLALVLVVGTALLAWWRLRADDTQPAMVTPLTSLVGQEQMPALSPDGTRVVFAWNGASPDMPGFDLFLKPVDSALQVRLTNKPAIGISAAWSPDGKQLAFARSHATDGGIFVIAATGGAERKIADAAFARQSLAQPAWSPDGRTLAFASIDGSGSQGLRVLSLPGGESSPLARAPPCWHAGAPAWSPDGSRLAFVCMTRIAAYGIYITDPRSNAEPRLLATLQGSPQGLAWPRDGGRLLVANDSGDGGGVWELDPDGTLHRPAIAEESLGSGVSARRGRIAYSRARQVFETAHVDIVPRGFRTKKWGFSGFETLTPEISPDGSRVAFQSKRSGSPEIWLADADGGNVLRLTSFNGPLTGAPAWCSDGRRLAFDSRESGASAIYIVDAQERVPRRVETSQPDLALPAWSADCQWLLASDARAALYRVPAQGGEAQLFTAQHAWRAEVMNDRVVFEVSGPAGAVLWMKPLEGGAETRIDGIPRLSWSETWTVSGEAIYYTDSARNPVVIQRYLVASGMKEIIAGLPNSPASPGGLELAVSRDGKSLLYTSIADSQSDLVLATD